MSGKHGLEEADIQVLFMQRAIHGGDCIFDFDLDLNNSTHCYRNEMDENNNHDPIYSGGDIDVQMRDTHCQQDILAEASGETIIPNYTDDNDIALVDPVLAYMLEDCES
jgi:hypothetical protein